MKETHYLQSIRNARYEDSLKKHIQIENQRKNYKHQNLHNGKLLQQIFADFKCSYTGVDTYTDVS